MFAPIEILLAARATSDYRDVEGYIEALARDSCTNGVQWHFHALDPDQHTKL